ncbi:protease modulator HflC [Desulforegula conservatrix]|uniref:protease modulator HflC n=1 Tax=Desulforegula conservatrix TaxID=153026 RepID=UPI00040359E6|nr:protease modulator HflC [Desulforegula conservatrix]
MKGFSSTVSLLLSFVAFIAVLCLFNSLYIVNEIDQVVITQFGRVIGDPVSTPGLKFKFPFLQKANHFPKNLQEWDGDPGQIPTLDKTYIWVEAFARWRITDPVMFFKTVNNTTIAKARLDEIIDPAVRNLVTSYPLVETVRWTDRPLDTFEQGIHDESQAAEEQSYKVKFGREKITGAILDSARAKLVPFGIELVDVKIKRIGYVDQVRKAVYERMIAERRQIAEKFRSEGKGEAEKILGEKERELKRISSDAYRLVQGLKGKADAEAIKIYAQSYGNDPEFYSFMNTLEMYKTTFDDKSTLVIGTDSEFFKYLKSRD